MLLCGSVPVWADFPVLPDSQVQKSNAWLPEIPHGFFGQPAASFPILFHYLPQVFPQVHAYHAPSETQPAHNEESWDLQYILHQYQDPEPAPPELYNTSPPRILPQNPLLFLRFLNKQPDIQSADTWQSLPEIFLRSYLSRWFQSLSYHSHPFLPLFFMFLSSI